MFSRHRRIATGLLATAAIVLAGCSDSLGDNENVQGNYVLTVFAGENVPVNFPLGTGESLDVLSGTLVLRDDRSFSETIFVRFNRVGFPPENTNFVRTGTYTASRSRVELFFPAQNFEAAFTLEATVSGGVLTYVEEFETYRYQRQ